MNREDIINYLDACMEAEICLSDTANIIEVLKEKAESLKKNSVIADLPNYPVKEEEETDMRSGYEYSIRTAKHKYISAILSLSLSEARDLKRKIAENEEKLEKANADYPHLLERNSIRQEKNQIAISRYNQKNAIYRSQQEESLRLMLDELYDEIYNQEIKAEKFQQILTQLYDMNILYSEFRNSNAIYYLRRYLLMGVADQLEGADGAYKLYLDDLKVNKLDTSLKELQEAVESGFENVLYSQNAIYQQLLSTRNELSNLSRQLDSQTEQLTENLKAAADKISQTVIDAGEAQTELLKQTQEGQKIIRDTLEKSAYNQYIVEKEKNLDSYLAYRLQNPLIH